MCENISGKKTEKKPLPLVEMFCFHAQDLIIAAERGKRTHNSGNIAESGSPFEVAFRRLFSDALPLKIGVWPGYFMSNDLELSAQADFMLCDRSESLHLPPSQGLLQHYVPLNSVHVFGELKNTANIKSIESALQQNSANIQLMNKMLITDSKDKIGLPCRGFPISIIVFAIGGSEKMVREALESHAGAHPTYMLFVEEGMIFAPEPFMDFSGSRKIGFDLYRHSKKIVSCSPDGPTHQASGRVLMWFFFALLQKINYDLGNISAYGPLAERVSEKYPISMLSDSYEISE